MNRSQ